MYQLFYSPGSCSMAVHVTLIEAGATFELLKAADNQEAFKKASPLAVVPTLVVDGKPLLEGAAILTYICENEKSALLPASGWDRAMAQQWLAFANSTVHPRYGALFGHLKKFGADAKAQPMYSVLEGKVQEAWDLVEAELEHKDYVAGTEITVADILLTVIANWTPKVTDKVTFGPRTKALFARVIARPAYQQALNTEQVEYKVAA